MGSEEWEKNVLLLSVGGTMQHSVTAWPGAESMKGEVVRVNTLVGTVAGKGPCQDQRLCSGWRARWVPGREEGEQSLPTGLGN